MSNNLNDPNDEDYRQLVWQEIQWHHPEAIPHKDFHDFDGWKRRAVDAEIERRRIGMIQRENPGRMRRGEPLIDPSTEKP